MHKTQRFDRRTLLKGLAGSMPLVALGSVGLFLRDRWGTRASSELPGPTENTEQVRLGGLPAEPGASSGTPDHAASNSASSWTRGRFKNTEQVRLGGLPAEPGASSGTPDHAASNSASSWTRGRFKNTVGWAYTAVPGIRKEQMIPDMQRMQELGANVVYLGHSNPGDANPNGLEPGLCYAVYHALRHQTPSKEGADLIYQAITRAVEAAEEVGLAVVLPVGYAVAMGPEWNSQNVGELSRNPDGSIVSYDGGKIGGAMASPYSRRYRDDIEEYYRWVNETVIRNHPSIAAVNLADEPPSFDYSAHALAEFERRYGKRFEAASAYERGEFQSGVLVDYAAWSASVWERLNPGLFTMLTFHVERTAPFFFDVERVFAETPDTFIFSADTHLHDAPAEVPLSGQDVNLLYGMTRTLGWLSRVYGRPLMLWTAANAWGLAGRSTSRGGVREALLNARIVHDTTKQVGGRIAMIMAWGWNIKTQGVYRDDGSFGYVDKEEMIQAVANDLAQKRERLSTTTQDALPEYVVHVPDQVVYQYVSEDKVAQLTNEWIELAGIDFVQQSTVYLTDGKALEQARAAGATIGSSALITAKKVFVVANTGGDGVILRGAPSRAGRSLGAYPDGTRLEQIGPDPEQIGLDKDIEGLTWRNVRAPDGKKGWLPAQYTKPVP